MIEPGEFIDNYRILRKVVDRNLSSTYIAENTSNVGTVVLITLWHGITFTTGEDARTLLQKARHGVIQRDSQRIPLLDAQLYHQFPYIVTPFDEKTGTLLDAHVKFIDSVVDNSRVLHPDNPHSSNDTFLSIFCIASEGDENGSPAGNKTTDERKASNGSTGSASKKAASTGRGGVMMYWRQRLRERRIYRVASVALLLALLAGVIALLIMFLPASTATITITPISKRITHTYAISLVDGNPGAGQIREHKISYTTPQQSHRVSATGKGHHDTTHAQGKVVISQIHLFNSSDNNSPIEASNVPANDGTMITIDSFTATEGGSVTVDARASTAGQGGNIPAYDINNTYEIARIEPDGSQGPQIGTAYNANPAAFTGGQDASDYTYVQQTDIDKAVTPLSARLTPGARQQAMKELKLDEQLVQDLTCSNNVSTDHKAQDTADFVMVAVKVTCSSIAYKKQDLLTAAINAQKADAITQIGTGYQPSGDITTGTPMLSPSLVDGSIIYQVPTDGVWVFQINQAQQQEIAHSIAGRSQRDATDQLLKRKGIRNVVISTAGSIGTALPTSPENIRFTIVHIPGLTSSPAAP